MEMLVDVREKLITFVSAVNSAEPRTMRFRALRSRAKEISDNLQDPFVIWGELPNEEIYDQLFDLRLRLKQTKPLKDQHNLAKPTQDLVDAITKALQQYKPSDIDIELKESNSEASGLIQQLNVRQKELNDAVSNSLQQIDERTGAAERQVRRIERHSIQAIRQEVSEIKEVHSDVIKGHITDGLEDINNTLNIASSKLSKNLRDATESLVKQHQAEYDTLYQELNHSTTEQIKKSDELRLEFERKINDLNRVFEEQAIELNNKFEIEKTSFKDALVVAVKDEVANYQSARSLLKEQLSEAKEIVGILSKKAMAHEHLKQARNEAYAYWGFQTAGLVLLFLAILMSVAMFGDSLGLRLPWLTWLVEFSSSNGTIQPHISPGTVAEAVGTGTELASASTSETVWFFKRISIVLLLTAPGLYLLKEAANHRVKENLYRQRGIQLASITPYLKELEECERNEIKKDLVKSFFSFHDGKADTQNVPDFLRDLKETTKIIRSIDRATQPASSNRTLTRRRSKRQTHSTKG